MTRASEMTIVEMEYIGSSLMVYLWKHLYKSAIRFLALPLKSSKVFSLLHVGDFHRGGNGGQSLWTDSGKPVYPGVRTFGCGEIGGSQVDKLHQKSLRVESSGHFSMRGVEIGGSSHRLIYTSGTQCTSKTIIGV